MCWCLKCVSREGLLKYPLTELPNPFKGASDEKCSILLSFVLSECSCASNCFWLCYFSDNKMMSCVKTVVPENVLIWFSNWHSLKAPLNYLHRRNFRCMVPAVLSKQRIPDFFWWRCFLQLKMTAKRRYMLILKRKQIAEPLTWEKMN